MRVYQARSAIRSAESSCPYGLTLHSIHGLPVPYGVPRFLEVKSLFSPIERFFEVEALPGAGAATVDSFYMKRRASGIRYAWVTSLIGQVLTFSHFLQTMLV